MPGMYAQVKLPLQEHSNTISVPLEAVERTPAGTRVFQVDAGGTVRVAAVKLGAENDARAEVLSGLNDGDQVIVGRRAGLKEGDRVRAKLMEPSERTSNRKDKS